MKKGTKMSKENRHLNRFIIQLITQLKNRLTGSKCGVYLFI